LCHFHPQVILSNAAIYPVTQAESTRCSISCLIPFRGGTDVTGTLVHAMDVLKNDLTSSDLLLVTDGKLPNPPVSNAVLAKLFHGLLVGKQESESLNMLCNQVHNFLGSYDAISAVATPYT
jgi:hypothetical protein